MDFNDGANDFKETKIRRTKNISHSRNKLSRNKKQKTTNSEVVERGSQGKQTAFQTDSSSKNTYVQSDSLVKCTSSYFNSQNQVRNCRSNVLQDTMPYVGQIGGSSDSSKIKSESSDLSTKNESSSSSIKSESSNSSIKNESDSLATKGEPASLSIKSELSSPSTSTITSNEYHQIILDAGEIALEQKSQQGNVPSTSLTTEVNCLLTAEKWWCIFCNNNLPSAKRDEHVKECILKFEYRTAAKKELTPEEDNVSSNFLCEVCKKDISNMNHPERNEHVNSCIDSQDMNNSLPLSTSGVHNTATEARPESVNISECPICGKQFISIEARLIHVKKCCKKHNMEPQQVISALQLQEKHALERIAIGLPPIQIKPATLKSNVNTRPPNPRGRRKKVPLPACMKSDPDLQIAMALSLSLKEEEKRKEEALKLLLDSSGFELNSEEGRMSMVEGRMSMVELKPPSRNQIPGRTKLRSKKNDLNKPVPALLLRTDEERLKLLQEKVSAIIAPVSPVKNSAPSEPSSEVPESGPTTESCGPSQNLTNPGSSIKEQNAKPSRSGQPCLEHGSFNYSDEKIKDVKENKVFEAETATVVLGSKHVKMFRGNGIYCLHHAELWTLSGSAEEKNVYYAPELLEWVALSEVAAGSKLQSLSQLPGHKVSHNFLGFEYSTFYCGEDHQNLSSSQNGTVKPTVDIPSTQEMLDVIVEDDACSPKSSLDSLQNSQPILPNSGDLYYQNELKNQGFFSELLKNVNQNATNPVIDCLHKLVGNPWMSDVNIIVAEQKNIPAHKLLLVLRCKAITKELQKSHNGTSFLDWTFVPFKVAIQFLNFIYTGFCQLDCSFKKEICHLFYRYDMAEAYETLNNDIEIPCEGSHIVDVDDISSEDDLDLFQRNPTNTKNLCQVPFENCETGTEENHLRHGKCRDSGCADCSSKDISFVSDCENERKSTVSSIKKFSPVTSPLTCNISRSANSLNCSSEVLIEDKGNSRFLNAAVSVDIGSPTFSKNSVLSQTDIKEYSPNKACNVKYSSVLKQDHRFSPNKCLPFICSDNVKQLYSSEKEQVLGKLKVPTSDQSLCSQDKNKKPEGIRESRITPANELALGRTEKLNNCSSMDTSVSHEKQNVLVCERKYSPISSLHAFHKPVISKQLITENYNSSKLNVGHTQDNNDISGASHSDCSFSSKITNEKHMQIVSPELFACDSDEEISCLYQSYSGKVLSGNSSIGTLHTGNSPERIHSRHSSELSPVFSQKTVCEDNDQEIIFMGSSPCKNSSTSDSYASMPSVSHLLESKIHRSQPQEEQSKGVSYSPVVREKSGADIKDSPIQELGFSKSNERFLDHTPVKPRINSEAALLGTPTSSKSTSLFKRQKRKLCLCASPSRLNELKIFYKRAKDCVQETDYSDDLHLSNNKDKWCTGMGKCDRISVIVNNSIDQPQVSSAVSHKGNNSISAERKSSSTPGAIPDHDSAAELEVIHDTSRNNMPDVWEGFDDDGYKEDFVAYENYTTMQLITPLKSSRDRPPTPHPSSAHKSAKKLSFVDGDVVPSTSPVPSCVELIDVDSSPISMQPLAERLGLLNKKKNVQSVETSQKKTSETEVQNEDKRFDDEIEALPSLHCVPHVGTPVKKTTIHHDVHSGTAICSPITPMPEYQKMVTPELKNQLKKYGIRALPRKKAVSILTHIYDETHPWQVETELNCIGKEAVSNNPSAHCSVAKEPAKPSSQKSRKSNKATSPQKVMGNKKQKTLKTSKQPNKKESKKTNNCRSSKEANPKQGSQANDSEDELNISSSQNSSVSGCSDIPEESVLRPDEEDSDDELFTASQTKSLEERMHNYIVSDQHVYSKILMYEPLNLPDFQQKLKQNGIRIGQTKLMDFLDEMCVTFTLPRSEKHKRKQEARNKRFRQRVISKVSQKSDSQKS